ncbi:MAG: hypothetical protein NTAFB05_25680 [Nitrobacter sp.]
MVGAKLHHCIARGAFGNLHVDAWVVFPVSLDQSSEEAARDQGMDADAKSATFPMRRHAGRFHGMVELIDADHNKLNEVTAGFRQPNASRMTLEQEDAKVFFQRLHAGTHA